MNVSDQVIAVLNDLCTKFGIAVNWSSENVLPYLKELMAKYIGYKTYLSIFFIFVDVLIIVISAFLIWWVTKIPWVRDTQNLVTVIILIVCLCAFVALIYNASCLIAVETFPEKLIINEIQRMVNKS